MILRLLPIVTPLLLCGSALAAAPATAPTTVPAAKSLTWHTTLQKAYAEAQASRQPMFLCFGAEWCGWCRKLEADLATPRFQQKLASWTCVRLDVDNEAEAARTMTVDAVPAMRILTPDGRTVASRKGYAPPEELIRWIDENEPRARGKSPQELLAAGPLDEAKIKALIGDLADADASVRENAIRRLTIEPTVAAKPVVEAFASGALAMRLSAIEVLSAWRAPIADIDPWQPRTITEAKLKALRDWAVKPPPTSRPSALSPGELSEVRQEIARMLKATTPIEVLSSRERLARIGPALMPEIYDQIKAVSTESANQRLTALRYRLVASDAMAIRSPALFDRLAAADMNIRHKALDELTKVATRDDQDLLLELFSDPDGWMRETALRSLQALGGAAGKSLVKLLHDPMPNVRAAVLKQLAETPAPGMTGEVVKYIETEKDADLVVHAVRVLRATKGAAATDCLLKLLEHESWRVRAESIEAIQEIAGRANRNDSRIQEAVLKRLEDPDGFVVSRAVAVLCESLSEMDLPKVLQPMQRAIENQPEVAPEIIKAVTGHEKAAVVVAPVLRKYALHKNATIRAAAIEGLCSIVTSGIETEVLSGLGDGETKVRIAAAGGLFVVMERLRPQREGAVVVRRSMLGLRERKVEAKSALPKWLDDFRSGKQREAWMEKAIPLLRKMLSSADMEERLVAAPPLVAMGQEAEAMPVLMAAAKARPIYCKNAAAALSWLPVANRVEVFRELMKLPLPEDQLYIATQQMSIIPEEPATQALWDQLTATVTVQFGASVYSALSIIYQTNSGENSVSASAVTELTQRAQAGSEMQRLVALVLLTHGARAESVKIARGISENPRDPQALRMDALTALLYCGEKNESRKLAAAIIAGDKLDEKKLAIEYLASNGQDLRYVRNGAFYLPYISEMRVDSAQVSSAPKEIKPEMLKPLLRNADADLAANSGYLLALLGDREGIDPLVRRWRAEQGYRGDRWRMMVYTAISALNDDSLTSVLEEIYASFEKDAYEVRQFYRTIRSMTGPKVMELRKKMRREVGPSLLQ